MFSTIDSLVLAESSKILVTVLLLAVESAPSSTSSKVRHPWQTINSFYVLGVINAPRRQRIWSGLCLVRNRAPFLGGSFGLWGGLFSTFDCMLIHYRQKDDPWNAIVAGFMTGGVLQIRAGVQQAFK